MIETRTALDGSGDEFTRAGFEAIDAAHEAIWGRPSAGEVVIHQLGRGAFSGIDAGFLALNRQHINAMPGHKVFGTN